MMGNLIVNILSLQLVQIQISKLECSVGPLESTEIWMKSETQIFLRGPNVSWGDKSRILLTTKTNPPLFCQSKQSAGPPKQIPHLPQCCCFYNSVILAGLESWGLRWSDGPTGTVPSPAVHQCVINVCHLSTPLFPQPYKLFRRSYCTWWLIHVLRSANTR